MTATDALMFACPTCEAVGPEPCEDVVEEGVLAVLLADPAALLRIALAGGGFPSCACCAVPLLVGERGWPAVLAVALAHAGDDCDPMECDACISKASVLQINSWHWQALEQVAL